MPSCAAALLRPAGRTGPAPPAAWAWRRPGVGLAGWLRMSLRDKSLVGRRLPEVLPRYRATAHSLLPIKAEAHGAEVGPFFSPLRVLPSRGQGERVSGCVFSRRRLAKHCKAPPRRVRRVYTGMPPHCSSNLRTAQGRQPSVHVAGLPPLLPTLESSG